LIPKSFYLGLLRLGGDFFILDWGWPKGQWQPLPGLLYRLDTGTESAADKWSQEHLTYGPRKYMGMGLISKLGKPWRRLV